MLIIRNAQLSTLETPFWDAFLAKVAAHIDHHFPERAREIDGAKLAVIMTRARAQGLVSERALLKYANVAVVLGADFESRLPWTASYLSDAAVGDPDERAHRLHEEVLRRLELEEGT